MRHGGEGERRGERRGVGDSAFIFGALALVASAVPMIGEWLALPLAVAALVLGLVGVRLHERGVSPRVVPAVVGSILGVCAGLVVFVVFIATVRW